MKRLFLIVLTILPVLLFDACVGGSSSGSLHLSAVAQSPGEVELSWNEVNTIGYNVYRDGSLLYSYAISGTSLIDHNLKANTTYCYQVVANGYTGVVATSNTACVKTPPTAGWPIETVDTGSYPAFDFDPVVNAAHVVYRNTAGLMYATDKSGTWSTEVLDANAGTFGDASIVLDTLGAVHASYYFYPAGGLHYAQNSAGNLEITPIASIGGYASSITRDDAGHYHISYEGTTYNALMYAEDTNGSWQTHYIMGFSNASVIATDLAVDANGTVHIAFLAGQSIGYYTNGSGSWAVTWIDTTYQNDVAMGLDRNGFVHIVYMKSMQLMHATNASGTWTTSVIDTFSWVGGADVSLDIDENDCLHISYVDTDGYLKYATNASGTWKRIYIDGSGGHDNTIRVTPSGSGYIVYGTSGGQVKIAKSPY